MSLLYEGDRRCEHPGLSELSEGPDIYYDNALFRCDCGVYMKFVEEAAGWVEISMVQAYFLMQAVSLRKAGFDG